MPDDDKKKPWKIFFLQEKIYIFVITWKLVGMTKSTNAAADAKRDEAEEINIFIALPGGTNASTKFKVVTVCPMQQQKAAQYRPPLVLLQQWWLCQGAKVLIHILKGNGGHAMHENVKRKLSKADLYLVLSGHVVSSWGQVPTYLSILIFAAATTIKPRAAT